MGAARIMRRTRGNDKEEVEVGAGGRGEEGAGGAASQAVHGNQSNVISTIMSLDFQSRDPLEVHMVYQGTFTGSRRVQSSRRTVPKPYQDPSVSSTSALCRFFSE